MNLPGNEREMASANNYVDEAAVSRLRAKPFPPGSVIFPKVGAAIATNKKRLLARPALVDNNVMGIWSLDQLTLSSEFLYYSLLHIDLRTLSAPGPLPSITQQAVLDLRIPIPSRRLQDEISAVLLAIQRSMAVTEKVVAATRELKRSLLRHLLRYGPVPLGQAENVVLKETDIGWVPKHWDVKTLREIVTDGGGSLQTGPFGSLLHASSYVADGIPFIMPKDLTPSGLISLDTVARVSSEDQSRLSRYGTRLGDLLVARRGELGRRGLVTEREAGSVCGTGCLRIRPGARLNSSYLMYVFGSSAVHAWLESNAIGTTMANLSTSILARLPLPIPPLHEQSMVADLLAGIDRKAAAEENYGKSLEGVFGSMLSNFMTSRQRVASEGLA